MIALDDPLPMVLATWMPNPNAATKLKKAAHTTRLPRSQHPGRDDGGDGVGRVVKPVDVIEDQVHDDDDDQGQHHQPCLTREFSISTAASSHRSVADSSMARMSFLISWMGSFSCWKRRLLQRYRPPCLEGVDAHARFADLLDIGQIAQEGMAVFSSATLCSMISASSRIGWSKPLLPVEMDRAGGAIDVVHDVVQGVARVPMSRRAWRRRSASSRNTVWVLVSVVLDLDLADQNQARRFVRLFEELSQRAAGDGQESSMSATTKRLRNFSPE